jgi:putative efflux protein, MATE family
MGFALPVLIGNLLTTGYSIINTIWVGNLLGRDAVGAVAVSFPIFLAMIALCSGTTLATSILISKAYGAGDHNEIQRVVNNSWGMGAILIILIVAGGLLFSDSLLRLLGTPDEIMPLASEYLKITVVCFISIYLSNLIAAILRGIGNTTIPLLFITIATAINALLDPLLILGLGPLPQLGLNGAAYASLIASTIATVLGICYVKRKYKAQPVNPSKLALEREMAVRIIRIGIPSFIQQMLVSLGYAFITSFVNGFGPSATAAFGVASRIDSIAAMPAMAMMISVSAITAQNIGAGKKDRIREILRCGILANTPVLLVISLLCFVFPDQIMRIFVKNDSVIRIGVEYLRIVGPGYITFAVFNITNGIINGAGKTISTMMISFVSLCLIRIPLAAFLSETGLGLKGIWFAIIISFAVTTINSFVYYRSGLWDPGRKMTTKIIEPEKDGRDPLIERRRQSSWQR